MKPEILTALRGSIKKWEDIVAGTGVDHGSSNCPLCQLFTPTGGHCPDCEQCPIVDISGEIKCWNTPYGDWDWHLMKEHPTAPDRRARCPECVSLAQAEVDFLRSLLPEKEEGGGEGGLRVKPLKCWMIFDPK